MGYTTWMSPAWLDITFDPYGLRLPFIATAQLLKLLSYLFIFIFCPGLDTWIWHVSPFQAFTFRGMKNMVLLSRFGVHLLPAFHRLT